MSLQSAFYLRDNFDELRTNARKISKMIAEGNNDAVEGILRNHFRTQPREDEGEVHSSLWYAVHGHFGDLLQGLTYSREDPNKGPKVLVGFKIRDRGELVLFSPLVACLAGEHQSMANQKVGKSYAIKDAMIEKFGCVNVGSGSDGIVGGYVSLKHEGRGDFSFGVANDSMTYVLFFLLIERIEFFADLVQLAVKEEERQKKTGLG